MILKIRAWCEELIIAIILCIIIECLIPNGNNKKYAKVIIGIFIMFITINPALTLLNNEFDFGEMSKFQYEETVSSIEYDMKDIYIIGIEETIKKEIIDLGYEVNKIEIKLDYNCENINEVKIEILKNENRDSIETTNILKMLNEKYLVKENNVFIIFK